MFQLRHVKYKNILDIDLLEIPCQKVTCIIGESGSGKSTLLKLFNKLISHDSGEILHNGQPLNLIDSIELRRKVIMLPQNPPIFSGTIQDNLQIGLKFAEKPCATEDKLNEVLKFVSLNKGMSEDSDKLSGGEKQRLALARLILLDPDIYLLDEPSSALDEETERLIIERLASHTRQTNKTLIMVTHSRRIAHQYSDMIIEISNGKVVSSKEGPL